MAMKLITIANNINRIINEHLERQALKQGARRYFSKEFVTEEMLRDKHTMERFDDFAKRYVKEARVYGRK